VLVSVLAVTVVFVTPLVVVSGSALAQTEPCPPGQPSGRVPGTPPGPGAVPDQPSGRPAQYPPGKCQLRLSRSVVAAGESVAVSGDGFAPGARIRVAAAGVTLANLAAGPTGSFTTDVVIPASVDPGTYDVTAAGPSGGGGTQVLSASLTVTSAVASRSRTAGLGDELPRTGNSEHLVPTATAGLALVGVGVAAVIASRRRRTTAPMA
jgi:LPXTG-motif cell wall-anchored protein